MVELFGLDPEWLKKPLSLLVHHVTGWDILRPEAEQGSDDVLTFDAASKLGRRGLLEIHQQRLHLKKPAKKLSIAKLLAELFPREAREHDSVAHKRRAELRQQQVRDLATIRERVLVNRLTKKKLCISLCVCRFEALQGRSTASTTCGDAIGMPSIVSTRTTTHSFNSTAASRRMAGRYRRSATISS